MSEEVRDLAEQSADPRAGSTVWQMVTPGPPRHEYLWWVWIVIFLAIPMILMWVV